MLRRHDLVWLTPAGWDTALARLEGSAADLGVQWRDRGLPAVARRTEPGTPADQVCLGMPAPPDARTGQKPRIGITTARAGISMARPPLTLDETEALPQWDAAFTLLRDGMRAARIDCRVFGSLAMQSITGDAYVGPTSDIDLLVRPASAAQLDTALDLLTHHARALPLDGEIAFPSGHAVAWKEWLGVVNAQPGVRVLAKHLDSVTLMRCDELLRQFEAGTNA